jgi:nucleotide-binding universal stress UspA family protein
MPKARDAVVREPTVVVGVDGSAGGRHAFHWAIEEARVRRARLRAVYAWDPPRPVSAIGSIISPYDIPGAEQSAKELLEDAIDDVLQHSWAPFREIEPRLARGYPPKVLLDQASDGDLLVVGTRGRGGFGGLLLGSVSQHCVTHATGPIAVVPAVAPLPDAADVVVGVDGSEGSKTALRFAVAEAAIRGARLAVVHSWWAQPPTTRAGFLFTSMDREAFVASARKLLRDMTDEVIAEADRSPARVELLPLEAPPGRGLLDRAKSAGLLVVGSRGRGGFAGLFLGSVSQQCVHHATCAVVVVPQREQ